MSTTRSRRSGRTDVERLCAVVASQSGHKMSVAALEAEMRRRDSRWDTQKFNRKLDEALGTADLERTQGGRSSWVRYVGSERGGGAGGVALYKSVQRVLAKHGVPTCRCRDIAVTDTSRRRGGKTGRWFVPDLVAQCHPRSAEALDPLSVIHTFEVETSAGFSIESVYQAHAQGLGGDYSWVMFSRGRVPAAAWSRSDHMRILWAAQQLGIGLISFSNGNSVNTWSTVRKAERRTRTLAQRSELMKRLGLPDRPGTS